VFSVIYEPRVELKSKVAAKGFDTPCRGLGSHSARSGTKPPLREMGGPHSSSRCDAGRFPLAITNHADSAVNQQGCLSTRNRGYRLGQFISRPRIDADNDEDHDDDCNDGHEGETSQVVRYCLERTRHTRSLSSESRVEHRDDY
jgi:hypothetical protein